MSETSPNLYLGVDLGGTKIAVSLWSDDGEAGGVEKLDVERWGTLPDGPGANLDRIVAAGRRLAKGAQLTAIGISGGGPLDPVAGVILSVPNLAGWVNVPIASILSERLGAPARIENDANACAVAEWLHGAGRGARNLAFLTCSTGIGAGLILDGRLYRGTRFLAGEVGHHVIVPAGLECGCGNRGCLEAYASGAGMAKRLAARRQRDAGKSLPETAREAVESAQAGDVFSIAFLRETAEYLAMGLANLIFILNLDRIVLGTIPTAAGALLFDPLRESLKSRLWPALLEGLDIVPSALWPDLGDYAALAVARDLAGLLGE